MEGEEEEKGVEMVLNAEVQPLETDSYFSSGNLGPTWMSSSKVGTVNAAIDLDRNPLCSGGECREGGADICCESSSL